MTLSSGDAVRFADTVCLVCSDPGRTVKDPLGILGQSPALAELRALLKRADPSSLPVLAMAETGTGKERVAEAVHRLSGRRGEFV
ncbi:MAG: DNA-binding NtrC family response regulator, partial [Myxococcota bacterium]